MTDKDFQNIVEISTDKPTLLIISNNKRTWCGKLLQKLGIYKRVHKIEVYPIRLGTRQRYSHDIACLSSFVYENRNSKTLEPFNNLTADHISAIIKGCVRILHGMETNPPKELVKIVSNLSDRELWQVLKFANGQLDAENFLNSIISMAGMSLQPGEIIAPDDSIYGNLKETL